MRRYLFVLIFSFVCLVNSAIASDYIIDSVPFFPSKDYQCGPSSLAMVLNFLGLKITPEEISKEIYSEGAKGTADFDMIIYAKLKGFKALYYKGSFDNLKENIMHGRPLIVMVDEGFWFYKKYHFMVVVGFDDLNVIVNSGEDKHKRIALKDFIKSWQKTDFWTLLIEKNLEAEDGSSENISDSSGRR